MTEGRGDDKRAQELEQLAARWFDALDERRVGAGTRAWVARVVGIHCSEHEVWVQLARGDRAESSLVLHACRWTTIDRALDAVGATQREGTAYPRVVSALPVV